MEIEGRKNGIVVGEYEFYEGNGRRGEAGEKFWNKIVLKEEGKVGEGSREVLRVNSFKKCC